MCSPSFDMAAMTLPPYSPPYEHSTSLPSLVLLQASAANTFVRVHAVQLLLLAQMHLPMLLRNPYQNLRQGRTCILATILGCAASINGRFTVGSICQMAEAKCEPHKLGNL